MCRRGMCNCATAVAPQRCALFQDGVKHAEMRPLGAMMEARLLAHGVPPLAPPQTHTRASPAQNKCTNLNEGLAQAASAATRVLPAITEQLELVLQPSRSIQLPYARTCSAENTASSLLAQQTASPSACQQRHRRRSHNNVAPAVATSCGMLPKNGQPKRVSNPAALTTHVQARAIEDRRDVTGPVDVSDHQQGWLGAGRHSEADFGCPASRAGARGVEDYWCSSPCTIGIDCERLDRS